MNNGTARGAAFLDRQAKTNNGEKAVEQVNANAISVVAAVNLPATETAAVSTSESREAVVSRLAALPAFEYEKVREKEAKRLGVRYGVLDDEVAAVRKSQQDDVGQAAMFPPVVPWPEPVDPVALLDQLYKVVQRFIVCEHDAAIAVVLWSAFTWLINSVGVAPLLVITAPEKRCGKTQLLTLVGRLSCKPLVASNIRAAAVYRVIEAFCPTLLIDEADSFLKDNEELRGVINSGHTRQSAYVVRCVGEDHTPHQFSTWGAKAISGIGHLADTLMDRSIVVALRRKLPGESVERLRHAELGLFDDLVSKLARFAQDAGPSIAAARPELPDELNDRAQDNWEPLLAIADYVKGDWPALARQTALVLSGTEQESISSSAELLADIRDVFVQKNATRMFTADLLGVLTGDDLKAWATFNRGRPMSPRQLANQLDEFGIKSRQVRIGYDSRKGYEVSWFDDAFRRYLPGTPDDPEVSETTNQNRPTPVVPSDTAFRQAVHDSDASEMVPPNVADRLEAQHIALTLEDL